MAVAPRYDFLTLVIMHLLVHGLHGDGCGKRPSLCGVCVVLYRIM
jgi:hypothetical protein